MAIQPPQRFQLDDLTHVEREARTIYAPGATPGDVLVVQSDHSLVAAPGGGAMPGALRVLGPFPFAFNTAGLVDGAAIATLAAGDVLYDCALSVAAAWDGTTPLGDISLSDGDFGVFGSNGGAVALDAGTDNTIGASAAVAFTSYLASAAAFFAENALGTRGFGPVIATGPLSVKVVVSQSGVTGGASPGASQGNGNAYLLVATPALA